GGRRARRPDRARGDGVEDRRRADLLPPEPGSVGGAGDVDGGQRLHRADHPHAADGVRGRVVATHRAPDGRLRRLTSRVVPGTTRNKRRTTTDPPTSSVVSRVVP